MNSRSESHTQRSIRISANWVVALAVALSTQVASAADADAEPLEGEKPVTAAAQAGALFEQGLRFSEQGAYPEALAAFEQAYQLSPHPSVRFNIAEVQAVLGHVPNAIRSYESYLEQSSDKLSDVRRAQIEQTVEALQRRLVPLQIRSEPEQAAVLLDGVAVGMAPLRLSLLAGSHSVELKKAGYVAVNRRFELHRGSPASLELTLEREQSLDAAIPLLVERSPKRRSAQLLEPTPLPPPRIDRSWLYVTGGATVVLVGLSASLWGLANRRWGDYLDKQYELNTAYFNGHGTDQMVSEQERNDARLDGVHHLDMAAVGVGVAAGATLTAGVLLYFLQQPVQDRSKHSALGIWRF